MSARPWSSCAVDIDRFYRRTGPADVLLALSLDAKGVVMLPKDLLEHARKDPGLLAEMMDHIAAVL